MADAVTSEPSFRIDAAAISAGGRRAGQYLDSIGVTDLAKLNKAQWDKFCTTLVLGTLSGAIDGWVEHFHTNNEAPF